MSHYLNAIPDPKCRHVRKGIVSAGDMKSGPHVSHICCDRPECITDMKEWAYAMTRLPAQWRPDQSKAATEPTLFEVQP